MGADLGVPHRCCEELSLDVGQAENAGVIAGKVMDDHGGINGWPRFCDVGKQGAHRFAVGLRAGRCDEKN